MNTTEIGRKAEVAVARYITAQGYDVIAQNWRTRWCEIDIVAQKSDTIYFVEVKYRKNSVYGDGFAYITPKKLRQMQFAADFWVACNNWRGDYMLMAAAVTGSGCDTVELVEIDG